MDADSKRRKLFTSELSADASCRIDCPCSSMSGASVAQGHFQNLDIPVASHIMNKTTKQNEPALKQSYKGEQSAGLSTSSRQSSFSKTFQLSSFSSLFSKGAHNGRNEDSQTTPHHPNSQPSLINPSNMTQTQKHTLSSNVILTTNSCNLNSATEQDTATRKPSNHSKDQGSTLNKANESTDLTTLHFHHQNPIQTSLKLIPSVLESPKLSHNATITMEYDNNTFKERYMRNHKRGGMKNLRCFPECSTEKHFNKGFCGQSVFVTVSFNNTFLTENNILGVEDFTKVIVCSEFARFNVDSSEGEEEGSLSEANSEVDLKLNGLISEKQISELRKSRTNVNGTLYQANVSDWCPNNQNINISNETKIVKFEINKHRLGWNYSWVSKKNTCNDLHCLKTYVLLKQQQPNEQEAILKCVAIQSSPPFMLYCRRRRNFKDLPAIFHSPKSKPILKVENFQNQNSNSVEPKQEADNSTEERFSQDSQKQNKVKGTVKKLLDSVANIGTFVSHNLSPKKKLNKVVGKAVNSIKGNLKRKSEYLMSHSNSNNNNRGLLKYESAPVKTIENVQSSQNLQNMETFENKTVAQFSQDTWFELNNQNLKPFHAPSQSDTFQVDQLFVPNDNLTKNDSFCVFPFFESTPNEESLCFDSKASAFEIKHANKKLKCKSKSAGQLLGGSFKRTNFFSQQLDPIRNQFNMQNNNMFDDRFFCEDIKFLDQTSEELLGSGKTVNETQAFGAKFNSGYNLGNNNSNNSFEESDLHLLEELNDITHFECF